MLEKLDALRKAPEPVRERFVFLVTIGSVIVITLIWFGFTLHSFFSNTPLPAPQAPAAASQS